MRGQSAQARGHTHGEALLSPAQMCGDSKGGCEVGQVLSPHSALPLTSQSGISEAISMLGVVSSLPSGRAVPQPQGHRGAS